MMSSYFRFVPVAVFFLFSVLIVQQWSADFSVQVSKTDVDGQPSTSEQVSVRSRVTESDVPVAPGVVASTGQPLTSEQFISVETDVFKVFINPEGGDLVQAELLKYPVDLSGDGSNIQLLSFKPESYFVAGSGLSSRRGPDKQGQRPLYQVAQKNYQLGVGSELSVPLVWTDGNGLKVTKTYFFKAGQYDVQVRYDVENRSSEDWVGYFYTRLTREYFENGLGMMGVSSFNGMALSTPEDNYQKVDYDESFEVAAKGGWSAMLQHYFVTAWVPDQSVKYQYKTKHWVDESSMLSSERYRIQGVQQSPLRASVGESVSSQATLYVGPKIQSDMKKIHADLPLTVDYGWLWFISDFLFLVLKWLFQLSGNWGVAIIIVTLFIKMAFYPLSSAQFRSMAKMRKIAPRLKELKEKHGEDRQKFSMAMMELYKKEKVNPLGGCLPMLVQVPVFIALYWVLFESVELRQAPFMLWIQDLSVRDPFFVLPLLMGATMVIQQRLNPPPADPMQEKIFKMMPIIFTVMFLFFPAGLVLYWLSNNTLSILQQWWITRKYS